MSKKIGLHVGGRRFEVDVEDEFAPFLESEMAKDFKIEGTNELKSLLQAYIRKNHALYLQEKKIGAMLSKIEKIRGM